MATTDPFSGSSAFNSSNPASLPGFGSYYFNQTPFAGTAQHVQNQGQNLFSGLGGYTMQNTPSLYSGYSAASLKTPTLNYLDYLTQMHPQLQGQYARSQNRFYGGPRRIL